MCPGSGDSGNKVSLIGTLTEPSSSAGDRGAEGWAAIRVCVCALLGVRLRRGADSGGHDALS